MHNKIEKYRPRILNVYLNLLYILIFLGLWVGCKQKINNSIVSRKQVRMVHLLILALFIIEARNLGNKLVVKH